LVRRVHSGSSYLSTSEMAVTFGLGTSSEVDRVEIVWSGGSVEEWSGIDGNQSVTLVEGTGRRIE